MGANCSRPRRSMASRCAVGLTVRRSMRLHAVGKVAHRRFRLHKGILRGAVQCASPAALASDDGKHCISKLPCLCTCWATG